MSTEFKAIFFDFDGLILDTEVPEVTAWRQIFAEYGCEYPDWCWKEMIGQLTPESTSIPHRVLQEITGRTFDRDLLEKENLARRLAIIGGSGPMPGVVASIHEAKGMGLRVAVVSSSHRAWVETHLARLGLLQEFETVVCGGEGLPSKPDPGLYVEAIRRLETEACKAIAIEDSPNGIRAAKAAGMRCVAIPNALTRELSLDHADLRHESLEDITIAEIVEILGGKGLG